tara:strand:- start:980 stop:1207 length:228 start_codon:yes stop_codon:yes gene_type:complete
MSKAPSERLLNGRYVFEGVPNNDEGETFYTNIRKYLSTGKTTDRVVRRYRGKGNWHHSISSNEADSFVIYIDERT